MKRPAAQEKKQHNDELHCRTVPSIILDYEAFLTPKWTGGCIADHLALVMAVINRPLSPALSERRRVLWWSCWRASPRLSKALETVLVIRLVLVVTTNMRGCLEEALPLVDILGGK